MLFRNNYYANYFLVYLSLYYNVNIGDDTIIYIYKVGYSLCQIKSLDN